MVLQFCYFLKLLEFIDKTSGSYRNSKKKSVPSQVSFLDADALVFDSAASQLNAKHTYSTYTYEDLLSV